MRVEKRSNDFLFKSIVPFSPVNRIYGFRNVRTNSNSSPVRLIRNRIVCFVSSARTHNFKSVFLAAYHAISQRIFYLAVGNGALCFARFRLFNEIFSRSVDSTCMPLRSVFSYANPFRLPSAFKRHVSVRTQSFRKRLLFSTVRVYVGIR